MYVLDSNTLIYFFKGIGSVSKHLLAVPPKEIGIPSIVLFELEVGIAKSTSAKKRLTQLQDFLSIVKILPFSKNEARSAAEIRVNLERKGTLIGPYDILIAATAISNQGILVTHNTKEFSRVKGLKLEDWYR
ncbi:type II toxin-antitoxin system VapC family toxin [Thermodesulfobacteriota bacterium]